MKHCLHHSTSFRHHAVISLCEYLSGVDTMSLSELFAGDINALLDVAGSLFIDNDARVRAEGRRLFKLIADSIGGPSAVNISPFFNLLIARLCCAMTHLHEDIRFVLCLLQLAV